jgi:hypothetical protein
MYCVPQGAGQRAVREWRLKRASVRGRRDSSERVESVEMDDVDELCW